MCWGMLRAMSGKIPKNISGWIVGKIFGGIPGGTHKVIFAAIYGGISGRISCTKSFSWISGDIQTVNPGIPGEILKEISVEIFGWFLRQIVKENSCVILDESLQESMK